VIKGKIRLRKNIDFILSKISEYDIYRYYIGYDFRLGKTIHSPFRRDSTPSFSVIPTVSGRLKHKDFGDLGYSGDCVEFVMQLFGITFKEAIDKIIEDFGLYQDEINFKFKQPKKEDFKIHKKLIQVVSKKFTQEELHYWAQFGITLDELKDNRIYSVSKLYIDKVYISNRDNFMRFAYIFDDEHVKIYTPHATKENKFITNAPIDLMSGLDKLGKGSTVVVTKSKKDEIVLRKFVTNVCSVQAENIKAINDDNIKLLKSKYDNIIINFDSDEPGVKACTYYNKYDFDYINVPKKYKPIKDFSDLAKEKGLEEVKKVLYEGKITRS
jgi:5S rRNA maturation endonuclease (ribonuclease M5)